MLFDGRGFEPRRRVRRPSVDSAGSRIPGIQVVIAPGCGRAPSEPSSWSFRLGGGLWVVDRPLAFVLQIASMNISVSLPDKLVAAMDSARGDATRSRFIQRSLSSYIIALSGRPLETEVEVSSNWPADPPLIPVPEQPLTRFPVLGQNWGKAKPGSPTITAPTSASVRKHKEGCTCGVCKPVKK